MTDLYVKTGEGHYHKATEAEVLEASREQAGVIPVPQELCGMSQSLVSGETEFTIWVDDPDHNLWQQLSEDDEYEAWLVPVSG